MKKIAFLIILILTTFLMVDAQKENGTVYSEHESIAKTKALWAAFINGDKETFTNLFADSVWVGINGDYQKMLKKDMKTQKLSLLKEKLAALIAAMKKAASFT